MDVDYRVDHPVGHPVNPVSEEWRLPDLTAAYLCVDRDVCRRAFFGEPVGAVSEAVQAVLAQKDASEADRERVITEWARGRGAGLFGGGRGRGRGGLQHVGAVADDLLLGLVERRPRLDPAFEYHLYLAVARAEERRLGRHMTPSELDRFERRFHATGYRRNLEAIPPEGWADLEAEFGGVESGPQERPPAR